MASSSISDEQFTSRVRERLVFRVGIRWIGRLAALNLGETKSLPSVGGRLFAFPSLSEGLNVPVVALLLAAMST
jgi:hypothetical protein